MYEARIPTVFEQRYERCTSDQDFVDHEQSPEATVIAGAVVIVVVNRKAHQERNRSKSLAGRVAAVLYTESVSARPSGTPPARLLHAYRSGNSGASRLAHLTSTAPEPRKSYIRRRQLANRTRRNTPRHVRNMGASCVLTRAETGNQALKRPLQRRVGIQEVGEWVQCGWRDGRGDVKWWSSSGL